MKNKVQTLVWKKLPSVTREGRYFYNSQTTWGTRLSIVQPWMTGDWQFQIEDAKPIYGFKTAKAAMSFADSWLLAQNEERLSQAKQRMQQACNTICRIGLA